MRPDPAEVPSQIIAVTDVHYQEDQATAAAVIIDCWQAERPQSEHIVRTRLTADYQPGQFYQRELPCLLALLKSLPVTPDIIIVDGYVWLDDDGRPGLGAKLYQALDRKTTIVGIAKTRFSSAPGVEVLRGKSTRPLYVTAAGLSEQMAADYLCEMHGKYRIPTILKRADQLARGNRHPVESRSGASRRSG